MRSIHTFESGALCDWSVGQDSWNHIVTMIDWLSEHWHNPGPVELVDRSSEREDAVADRLQRRVAHHSR